MTTTVSKLQLVAAVSLMSALLLVGCGKTDQETAAGPGGTRATAAGIENATTDVAALPNADLVFRANLADMRESGMYQKLAALAEDQKLGEKQSQMKELDKFSQDLEDITGLTKDDVSEIVAFMSFEDVDFSGDKPQNMDAVKAIMAAALTKDLSADQLEEAARKSAEANTEEDVNVARSSYQGTPVITLTNLGEDTPATITMAMAGGNRLLLAGTDAELKGALDRAASGNVAAISAADSGQSDMSLQFILPEAMRAKIRESAQQQQPGPGQQAAMAKTMQTLQSIGLNVGMDANMNVALAATMGSEDDARQLKSMLDNQILSFLRITAQMMAGGQPLNLLDSLKTEQSSNQVELAFTMTPADVDIFQKAAEQRNTTQGAPMPPPVPGN